MEMSSHLKSFGNKAKEIMHKRRLNHYYLKRTAEGKSYIAMLFDAILIKLAVLFGLFVFFYLRTLDFVFSSIITVQFLILYLLVSYRIKKIRLRDAIERVNKQEVKKKIYKDLINKTPFDFVEFIKDNLEKCNFSNLQMVNQRDLDLVGVFKNKTVGIRCFQFTKDYKVDANITRDFFLALRDKQIEEGVIVTTSSFSDDVGDFLHKVEDHIKIRGIDFEKTISIMKKAETYPTKKEIEKIILNQMQKNRGKAVEYRDRVVTRKKIKWYFISAIAIFIFGQITPYAMYYRAVAWILVLLGLISAGNYVWNLLKSNTEDKTEEIF